MRRTLSALSLLSAALACRSDAPLAPTSPPAAPRPNAVVLPASAYTASYFKPAGGFRDVNGRNLIVGTAGRNAVAMVLGGPLTPLPNGRGRASTAEAVNERGEIVGSIELGAAQPPVTLPAFWGRVGAPPVYLRQPGVASDINDQGDVVGTITTPQGFGKAFVWNPGTGAFDWLPPLSGGTNTTARAINNDRVVLGWSDTNGGIGGGTVLWQYNGSAWTVWQITSSASDIIGYDIDGGYGIVGHTMQVASYGDPFHAGYFNVSSVGRSYATAVTGRRVVTGWDEGVLPPGVPQSYGFGTAFVADRSGATTYLPYPVGNWTASAGYGLNDCGLVVGEVWTQSGWYPAVWDPGC
jgi:probable HAF family extracellular repeat protein